MLSSDLLFLQQTDVNLLVALAALLDEKQVGKAADRLNLTQPAMSQRLAKLRLLLDDPILVRAPGGFALTDKAKGLQPHLTKSLLLAQNILQPATFDPATTQGMIRFTTMDFAATRLTQSLFDSLLEFAPNIELEFVRRPKNIFEKLENGELDLALGGMVDAPPNIHARHISNDSYRFVVAKHHPLAAKNKITLADTANYSHIRYTPTGAVEPMVDALYKKHKLQRRVTFHSSSMVVLLEGLKAGKHIAVLPWQLTQAEVHKLNMVPLDVPCIEPVDLMLYWHARSHKDPLHIWFRQLWLELLKTSINDIEAANTRYKKTSN
ncbi:LysR family transcriptional regulator [Motilimonas cestriensis]|uniref:LysR family transcriptional regulator n=1 Tax=Motilimonas cestriensis TaxID=2742685 RepID=UPI003DA399D7